VRAVSSSITPRGPRLSANARAELRQILSFIAVGVVTASTNLVVFGVLVWAGVFYAVAAVIGFAISTVVSFILQRRFVFRSAAALSRRQAATFLAVQLCGLGVNLVVLTALIEGASAQKLLAEFIASALQSTFNYIANRFITFNDRAEPLDAGALLPPTGAGPFVVTRLSEPDAALQGADPAAP
jgi:putative flippase GtrA